MLLPTHTNRQRLLAIWDDLPPVGRQDLLQYADFLLTRHPPVNPEPQVSEPVAIPRPTVETPVAALKRLKRTYPMIEADPALLSDASQALMRKVLGDPDQQVIDQMENLFAARFQRWQQARQDKQPV